MQKKTIKALVIEDCIEDLELYKRLLHKIFNCSITEASFAKDGLERMKEQVFDIVYLDYSLPDMSGLELLSLLKANNYLQSPIVVFTGQGDEEIATNFLKLGVSDYVIKSKLSRECLLNITIGAIEKFQYKKLLQQKQRALYNFAHTISHDLKSPLNRIGAYSKLLKNNSSNQKISQDKYIDNILEDSFYCIDFINSLLLYAEMGRSQKTFETIYISEIINRSLSNLELEIKNKSAEIIIDQLPVAIQGDRIALIQLFQNLISNALKFNLHSVKIRIWAEQINKEYINIYIQDNGIGIAEDKVADIFLPFQRLNEAQNFEGFGLGLALCQMVIDQHMANISIKSKVNQGSVFCVELPVSV